MVVLLLLKIAAPPPDLSTAVLLLWGLWKLTPCRVRSSHPSRVVLRVGFLEEHDPNPGRVSCLA